MRKIIVILILLCSASANAQTTAKNQFADWLVVADMLRAKGIDQHEVNWSVVDPLCSFLIKSGDLSDYNECLYYKAIDSRQWEIDKKYCEKSAKAEYPDSMLRPRTLDSYFIIDLTGRRHVVQETTRPYFTSRHELKEARTAAYQDCMRDNDWNDPNDWVAGKREQKSRSSNY